jgi:segregation and condensation protein A
MENQEYRIQTEYFEGPFDLLLHLIRKKRMDIMDVKISEITSEYLYYLENCPGINPSREGDFLMTASTMIYIKSRSLLPRFEKDPEDTPEKGLLHALMEYDKVQKISRVLQNWEGDMLLLWKREEVSESFENREFDIEEVSTFQLAELFLNLVKRKEGEEIFYLESKDYSIKEEMDNILARLNTEGYLNFSEYTETLGSLERILVGFFALLELVRKRLVTAVQKRIFDTISVWGNSEGETEQ